MRRKLLEKLIKRKTIRKKDTTENIELFLRKNKRKFSAYLEGLAAKIILYVMDRYGYVSNRRILNGLKEMLKEEQFKADIEDLDALYLSAKDEAGKSIKKAGLVSFAFNEVDEATLASIRKNFFWVGKEVSQRVNDELYETVRSAFLGKAKREELSGILQEKFGNIIKQETAYFKDVCDHIISQGQNLARVRQGQEYGVDHYKVVAVIDSRTSKICRSMNGRIIPAEHLVRQADRIQAAKDINAKKRAAEWRNKPYFGRSDRLPSNFGIPPYHFRCRTILQPVWVQSETLTVRGERIKVKNTGYKEKGELFRHIDSTGTERAVLSSVWTHSGHKKPNVKKLIAALNSIKYYAEHAENDKRFIALSDNGIVIIFEYSEKYNGVYTFFAPDTKKEAEKYFKKYHKQETREVIKQDDGRISRWVNRLMSKWESV